MLKRAIYLGLAAVGAWQVATVMNRHRKTVRKQAEREALQTWEGEGGNPRPARPAQPAQGPAA